MPKKVHQAEELLSAFGMLIRRLRAETSSQGFSLTERQVVAQLARAGPTTIANLARAEGMKPQSMGAIIAALEAMGVTRREPHPTDGRQSLISLSAEGVALREGIRDAKRAWLDQKLAKLSASERETIFAAAEIIARMVRA